jgi:hypothetical protein
VTNLAQVWTSLWAVWVVFLQCKHSDWRKYLLCFPTSPTPKVKMDATFIFPSRIPNFQERLCLCFKAEVFVWHRIDCFCVMSPPPHKNIPAVTEEERNCSRWLGILGESNLSQDNTDVMTRVSYFTCWGLGRSGRVVLRFSFRTMKV